MTREEVRKAAEVMIAYVGGAQIQCREVWLEDDDDDDEKHYGPWCDFIDENDVHCNWSNYEYRVKPKSTYRPFKNAEECWEEMKKHEPFGWVKKMDLNDGIETFVVLTNVKVLKVEIDCESFFYKDAFAKLTFADGTPFGMEMEGRL